MRALVAGQLIDLLRKIPETKNLFKGISARDIHLRPPKHIKNKPKAYIQNTGYAKAGVHWVVLYFSDRETFLFDSYGRDAKELFLEASAIQSYRPIAYNPFVLQKSGSLVCGHFCVFFLYWLGKGYSVKNINRFFTSNRRKNDTLVFNFTQKIGKKWGVTIV